MTAFFRTAPQERLERRLLHKGDVVFTEGSPGDCAYLIHTGKIAITQNGVQLAVLGSNTMFGEMALLDGAPRMATASVLETTILIVIQKTVFEKKLEKADPFLIRLIRIMLKNLREVTRQTVANRSN